MKFQTIKLSMLSMLAVAVVLLTAGLAQAATITVGPTGQYPNPCTAFSSLSDGDTLLVDANGGVPYSGADCTETANDVTISGVNGRAVIDSAEKNVFKGLWLIKGHDVVIDNFEFRGTNQSGATESASGIRVQAGTAAAPGGGNVMIEQCYIYNDMMGLLSDNVGFAGYTAYAWYSPNPYITLQYDEFAFDGDGSGQEHNIYISAGGNMTLNMQYTFTHDSNSGHELKDRAEHSNIYYNFIGDLQGLSDYVMDFPLGGDTYVVGNIIYKAAACSDCNTADIVYRQYTDTVSSGAYPAPNDDMHFVNNTVIDDPTNIYSGLTAFVNMACYGSGLTTDNCPLPTGGGGPLTTPGVFENNIFVGPAALQITNQTEAVLKGNIVLPNNSTNLADLFVDPAHLDFHLAPSSPAIGAGVYPPTDNTGAADPLVLPADEYIHPASGTTRPTPSGTAMDAGAYSYPRTDTPPTLQLSYNNTVTAPNSGTITVSGMPTPPAGQFNDVDFVSGNLAAIPQIEAAETSTGSVTVTYQTNPVTATVTVPIDIYADGAHATATITVNPGPPVLYSVSVGSSIYLASDTVNLEGPAPVGGLVVNLSSSDQSVLYSPATVTIPAGQISAPTGTLAATFLSPSPQTETLTASADGVTKTLTRAVYTPRFANFGCNTCTVIGGQPAQIGAVISYGPAPESGAEVTITSNNSAVVPNQTIQVSPGETDFPQSQFNVNTNAVTQSTQVAITANFGPYSSGTATLTVNPGGPTAASVAVVSGSGQSAAVGTSFSNPLVVVVEDSSGNPVSGTTVTFAGSNVSFPSRATATTNSSGDASVTAQPSASGSLTITASVSGVSSPATFSETGTAPVSLSSITYTALDSPATVVNLTAPAPVGGSVITLSSSDPTVVYAPATVTVPAGATSIQTGTLIGSLWGQSPTAKSATLTATYGGATVTLTRTYHPVGIGGAFFGGTITGGNTADVLVESNYGGPAFGSNPVTITSDTPAVIPDQTFYLTTADQHFTLLTNTVSATTTVNVTVTYNGAHTTKPYTVNSSGGATSIAAVSGSGQTATVGTNFTNPLVVLVDNASSQPLSGVTVTFAGTGVSFPSGATAVTGSNGEASVVVQPTQSGSLTVTASVSSVSSPATFSETGTAPVSLSSITYTALDSPATVVNLTAPAPVGGSVITLSSSDPTVVYAPATVTVPAGATSIQTGTLIGSLWGQSPTAKSATLTATYGGATVTLTRTYHPVGIGGAFFGGTITGGNTADVLVESNYGGPAFGSNPVTITSDTPAVIPDQTFYLITADQHFTLLTNTVSATTTVNVTVTYNGAHTTKPYTVNP